ncbi:hypothetical protein HDU98_007071 [Podochytrium sp. JEL0797]|nr:hypothetical protein HDU98_007071 [Podochytrium sp. JEL0797]
MALFKHRTASQFAQIISEKLASQNSGSILAPGTSPSHSFDPKCVPSESQTSLSALLVQSLPILLFSPIRTALLYLMFTKFLCFFNTQVFVHVKHSPRGTVYGSLWIMFQLAVAMAAAGVASGVLFPCICLASKWLIIGKYKAGREFDLIHIYPDCVVATDRVSPFTMETGLMVLKPITIGSNSVLNYRCTIAPGSTLPANTVLPPLSSSYELSESSNTYRIFASTRPQPPNLASLLLIGYPAVAFVRLLGLLPWLAVLYWLVQYPLFSVVQDVSYRTLSPFGQLMTHQCKPYRIAIHILGAVVKKCVCPFVELFGIILVKRLAVGKFEAGSKKESQWVLLQHWIMSTLVRKGEFEGVYEMFGRHYQWISWLYRMLGAKIGERVYWPGTPMAFYEFDLLEVGDDVVFGSRTRLVFSDAIESKAICVGSGAMVADRCVVLPGVSVGRNAMIGSGSLLGKNGKYPAGSTWIGAAHGDAVLWEEGDAKAAEVESTVKPFGRGFYMGLANYTVFSQGFIFGYNLVTVGLGACVWVVAPLTGVIASGAFFTANIQNYPTPAIDAIGNLYFVLGVILSYSAIAITIFLLPILSKWILLGHLQTGNHNWDRSSYCQRWQMHISIQKILEKVQDQIRGSYYLVAYFRALGANVGDGVCLYPTGADPMMTEPDLVTIGDHTVIDKASVICHINSKGHFDLNKLTIGKGCVLRTDSRLLSGAEMKDACQLMEHTLVVGGEVVESGAILQGWPARDMRKNKRGMLVSASVASSQVTLETQKLAMDSPALPPPSPFLIGSPEDKPDAKVGIVVGFARTMAVQSSMLLMGFTKGLLKWWFRLPVKLFRPYAVNPYLVMNAMAAQDGKTVSTKYIRDLVQKEGFAALGRNMLPLMVVNSMIGAFLFNTYNYTTFLIGEVLESKQPDTPKPARFNWVPFFAGWTAGAAQSLLSTPVDNMQRSLSTDAILAHRHAKGGIVSLILANLKQLAATATAPLTDLVKSSTLQPSKMEANTYSERAHHYRKHMNAKLHPYKPLYQNFRVSCTKDSLGFALFFGLFENARDLGKAGVKRIQDAYRTPGKEELHPILKGVTITGPQALAVVGAGGLAGMGFQVVAYPIDRINAKIHSRGHAHTKDTWVHTVKKMGGIREVYRGIGGQFVRVVPASAVGLFVFEIVNEYLGP